MKKILVSNNLNIKVKLGSKLVGDGQKPYIIAEAGLNHNGDLQLAKKLIDEAKKTKCDLSNFKLLPRTLEFLKSKKY